MVNRDHLNYHSARIRSTEGDDNDDEFLHTQKRESTQQSLSDKLRIAINSDEMRIRSGIYQYDHGVFSLLSSGEEVIVTQSNDPSEALIWKRVAFSREKSNLTHGVSESSQKCPKPCTHKMVTRLSLPL